MSINLKGYTVLITGGSSGMGYEMARKLLSHGATVIISARNEAKLDKAYKQLSSEGLDVYAVPIDVSDEKSVTEAVAWFEKHFDHLDMLINNAGIGSNAPGMENLESNHHFYDIPIASVKAIVETNFIGYFIVSSKFVPLMVKNGRGSLIYVSTSTNTMTRKGQLPYGPSKAGAEAMAKIMAEELRDLGIMVNVICPGGFTDTGMAGTGVKEFFQKNNMEILQPTVMNKAILFLASSDSKGMTGEKIIANDFDEWLKNKGIEFDN
ncbi:SDR family NAD(P)-dependent oxidoreductase [Listeria costaricensis]|uniref:SDR family NAD(P)-dependent oxidoreductase n=1 Tax=Listeria costaricensis TaxID=2026604 RepID=UPI0013C4389D|nr:SDR family oxidoreductase [Listeria costaricensis]